MRRTDGRTVLLNSANRTRKVASTKMIPPVWVSTAWADAVYRVGASIMTGGGVVKPAP
jgi:hypothetical protein